MSWFAIHKKFYINTFVIEFNEVYHMFHLLPVFGLKLYTGKPEAVRIGWGKWIVEFYF